MLTKTQAEDLTKDLAAKVDWFRNDLAYTAPELYELKFSNFKVYLATVVNQYATSE